MNSECPQTCHDTQFLIPRVPEKFFFNRWGTGVRYFGSFAGCAKALKKKNILLEEIRVGEGGFFTPIFTPSEVMSPALTKQNGRFHTKPTQTNSCSTYSFIYLFKNKKAPRELQRRAPLCLALPRCLLGTPSACHLCMGFSEDSGSRVNFTNWSPSLCFLDSLGCLFFSHPKLLIGMNLICFPPSYTFQNGSFGPNV